MISLDTNVLIWGVKRRATQNRLYMLDRAQAFLKDCRDSRIRIMLAAQVVSEYLVGFDREAMRASLKILEKAFFLYVGFAARPRSPPALPSRALAGFSCAPASTTDLRHYPKYWTSAA